MKQDKKWLLREFRKLSFEFQNGYLKVKAVDVVPLIEQLDNPEKPIIPQFVSDWIEHCKENNLDLYEAFGHSDMSVEVSDFIGDMDADEFARAWLDYPNIEVEKEKLYVVELINNQLAHYLAYDLVDKVFFISQNQEERLNKFKKRFTEQEIKNYDERFWPFAVEVSE